METFDSDWNNNKTSNVTWAGCCGYLSNLDEQNRFMATMVSERPRRGQKKNYYVSIMEAAWNTASDFHCFFLFSPFRSSYLSSLLPSPLLWSRLRIPFAPVRLPLFFNVVVAVFAILFIIEIHYYRHVWRLVGFHTLYSIDFVIVTNLELISLIH